MNRIKHESESMIEPKEQIGSPVNDEDSSGGSVGRGGGGILKKGPWTSAEDAILKDYVNKHGEGNWNAVQKHSGLSRCGKSCRLRWANHLRPNLKKGAITQEEEMKIVELHAKMGNKWARMASILKGRTDNEIKNYWNTRTKRLQRAGIPVYPPGITYDPSNDNPQPRGSNEFSDFDKHHNEVLQGNKYSIIPTGGIFGNYKSDLGDLSYPSPFSDYPTPGFGFVDHGGNCLKRFREPDSFLPSGLPIFEEFGPAEKIQRSFGLAYPSHPDLIRKNVVPFGGPIPGSHALPNGNLSISRPLLGSVKLELPSLQFPDTTGLSTCLASSPPQEAVDASIRLPPAPCVSPRNSGLLEALLHESQALSSTTKNQASKSSSSALMVESPLHDLRVSDWGDCNDPNTPLGINAASVFSSSSMDDFLPSKATTSSSELDGPMHMDNLRPDALLASDWLDDSLQGVKDLMLNDNIELFLDDELCSEYKQVPSGEMSPTIMGEGMGLESYPWNNMPRVYQMSEIP